MNKHMQKQLQKWQQAGQHRLNQEALEILKTLHMVSHYPDKAHLMAAEEVPLEELNLSYPDLPILDLLRWAEGLMSWPEEPSSPKLFELEMMVMEGEDPNRVMKLIAGPHGEGSVEVNLWKLLEGTPEQQEEIKWELRSNLKYLLEDAQHELNLRRQRRELLRAQQKNRENRASVLTLKEEEILLDTIEVIIEDETARLTAQDTLNESEQELLEALQVAGVSPESTQRTEITQEIETKPDSTEVSNTSFAQEKIIRCSEDQVFRN